MSSLYGVHIFECSLKQIFFKYLQILNAIFPQRLSDSHTNKCQSTRVVRSVIRIFLADRRRRL